MNMEAETAMTAKACAQRIAEDLNALGIRPGLTILVHASFKALGPVPGGIETVIQGLLRGIGPDGTLLMPALTWSLRPPAVFDLLRTPSIVGAVPETFRTRPGTHRSLHPTHSVCAVGPRTEELLDDHGLDHTPCGPHSPFHKLLETEGLIVMLGCGLAPNTSLHALEEYVEPPYLYGPSFVFSLRDEHGRLTRQEYRTHGFSTHGYLQRYTRVADLEDRSFLRGGPVLQAAVFVLDAPRLKRAALAALSANPYFFVERRAGP